MTHSLHYSEYALSCGVIYKIGTVADAYNALQTGQICVRYHQQKATKCDELKEGLKHQSENQA